MKTGDDKNRKYYILSRVAAVLAGVLGLLLLYLVGRYNYNLFHSFVDGVSIVIAVCAFTIIWNSRRLVDNNYFLFTGIAFLFFAFLDSIHLLGNKDMGIFPGYGNLGPTFYIAGRYVLSISLLIAPLFIKRRLNSTLMFAAYSLATSLILLSVFYWRVFPACIVEGVGLTPFKVISDYVICLILLGATGLLVVNRESFDPRVLRIIVFSIALAIATGLTFTLYTDPFGITNMVGHLFQIASFYLVYLAFIETSLTKPQEILYRKLKQDEIKLTNTNVELQQEIAERKQAKEALERSRATLQAVLDGAPGGVVVVDMAGKTLLASAATRLIFGGPVTADAHGPPGGYSVSTPDGTPVPAGRLPLTLALQGQSVADAELTITRSDGTQAIILASATPLRNTTGEIWGAVTIFQDITERKHSEEAVRKSRDELEIRVEQRTSQLRESEETALRQKREIDAYYDSSPIGLCAFDRDLKYLRINQRLADLNGLPPSEHIGRTVQELLPQPLAGIIEPALRQVMETGEPITGMEFTAAAGGLPGVRGTWLQIINPLKDETEQVIGVTVAVQDITELRHLEEQLRQAQKMEALGTLTGGIAHDFNNILAGIIGFTELVLDDELPSGSPVRHHLELVLKGGFRGRDLIKQLLTFSRKTEFEAKPLSLTPLVKETVKLLRASIPTTITIDVTVTATSDTVLANATGIQQIVMNLAANAAYAMRESGGKLVITLADADARNSGLPPGAYLQLAVQDTGTGMDTEVMERIFEPFFTTKGVGDGTGMGLAVVYGIVKSLNGDVSVDSTQGVGSTFRVLLPKAVTDETSDTVRSMGTPKGKEHILFVDDEDIITELGTGLLERLGYTVTALTDSTKALELFCANPSRFDLIITDQTMPNLTGMRLAERILTVRPNMPIILCTGHSDDVNPAITRAAGIREFLMKPIARQELAEAVRKALDLA